MEYLRGRVAVITGGASGIGRASAIALASRDTKVVVADIDESGAAETVAMIVAGGGEAASLRSDVGDNQAFEELREFALDRFGAIHIVMNNVGGITRGLPEHIPLDEWQRVLNLNLLSVVRSNLAFLPHLIAQRKGHIVNTASFAGLYTYAFDRLPYAATKAAIVQISEGLSIYLREFDVGVTCLCPGPVQTNIAKSVRSFGPPPDTRSPGEQFALKQPDEVGALVVKAIEENLFMVPTDALVGDLLRERAADWDGFLKRQADHPHFPLGRGR